MPRLSERPAARSRSARSAKTMSLDPLQHALGEDHLLARDLRQGVEGDEGLRARPELAG
jgi:hypothetical protein